MNPNWLGVTSALLSFAAFFVAYRFALNKSLKTRAAYLLVATILALPGLSFAAYYAHIFPEPSWYYQFRSIAGSELLIVFIGLAGGLAATFLPRLLLVVPLLGIAAFSIVPFIKPFIGSIAEDTFKDKWDGEICLQSTPSTCGAASTASVIRSLGTQVTEREIAREAHSYAGGTEAWYLARSARARGYDVEFEFGSGFNPNVRLPAMVGVRLGSIGHFIAILGMEGDLFVVGEPLSGRLLMSYEDLLKRYDFTGFHMLIKKDG
ncbi:peptidase C39 [Akkermansiaceae bacterium]|nr:peptidase C39 [Akkermansiaceae bacterium]